MTQPELEPLPVSHRIRDSLHDAGVAFVHWKSNSHLAEALAGETDIDLFVRAADRKAFAHIMKQLGAERISSQPWARYPEVEDWLVFDAASTRFLHLHVYFRLLTGLKRVKHLHLPWEDILLDNLRIDAATQWPVPTAEMELVTLLVRIWAKMPPLRRRLRPKIPKHIQHELEWLLRETTLQGVQTVAAKLSLTINVTALQRLYESPAEPRLVLLLARQLYDQMRPHYQMSWGRALMRAAWLNAQAFVRKQLPHWIPAKRGKTLSQQGAIIAVIGADGSGKSTLSRDLARWLRYKLDVHQFYMGSGDGAGGPIHMIRRRVAGLIRSRKKQNRVPKTGSHAYSVLGRSYRLIDLVLMRRKLRMLRLGRQLASRGSVILLDRYPQNQVNGLNDGPRLQEGRGFTWAARREEKLYREAATIGPDMLIRLSVHPQTAQARKPDHHPDIIARKCEIIEKLEFPRSKVVNIDANQTYTEVLEHAKRSVWQFLTRQTKGSHGH